MQKKTSIKLLSILIATMMLLSVIPVMVFATEEYVYITVSKDGEFIKDTEGNPIVHVPVSFDEISSVDLVDYNLSDYLYDEDNDGYFETTALQLVIWAHENLYGGSWDDVTFTGGAGSSYFQGGVFGFDENLNYYLNGKYPLAGEGWGATTDQIVLEAGDIIDVAGFGCWGFYTDPAFGFHYFADSNNNITFDYTAEAGTEQAISLIRGSKDADYTSRLFSEPDYTVYYGKTLFEEEGSVTTDSEGNATVTFDEAGTYYLWTNGGNGTDGMGYHDFCDYYAFNGIPCIVSTSAYAKVTVNAKEETTPDTPEEAQDVSAVLNSALAQLATTVTEPVFGSIAGEWTVFDLARGGYYTKDNAYFADYYDRIVETVNTTAKEVNLNGALHKSKSTDNSRLIVALSAIGKDATSVGDWDLVAAYSANGFDWIKKQGINGTIWALIALDSNNYATSDETIRQQCVDAILEAQHDDGGWSLMANKTYASDPDITGMALQALSNYRDQEAVETAGAEAIACLSTLQHENGTFASGGSECSESCAWAIIGTTAWGINPDTDARFIKNGNSAVDGLLAHYVEEKNEFQHIIGAGTNAMGTDQGCYGLIAYDRFINGEKALYDFSDVTFDAVIPDSDTMTSILSLPAQVNAGEEFNGIVSIDRWDNEAGYKLIDFIMTTPENVTVTAVTAGDRLDGGEVSFNVEEGTTNLRVVHFDANENSSLTISGEEFPAELFTITFKAENVITDSALDFMISGMSVKLTSDSSDENAMIVVNTEDAKASVNVQAGVSFSAVCLYEGDGIDLIPENKKAVAVSVTGITKGAKLTFKDGETEAVFKYSPEITDKTNIATYVAIVDKEVATENFTDQQKFDIKAVSEDDEIKFGDINEDDTINAQDALGVVDAWLRKGTAPEDTQILTMNVNGDSRINTFDALGIVEKFVNSSEYGVVTKAATRFSDPIQ